MAAVRLGSEHDTRHGGVGLYLVPGLGIGTWDDETKLMTSGSLQVSTWLKRGGRDRHRTKEVEMFD